MCGVFGHALCTARSSTDNVNPAVWDSRTIHWNASPVGDQTRFVTYVCYCPRSLMDPSELEKKLQVFRDRKGTTHWPVRDLTLSL